MQSTSTLDCQSHDFLMCVVEFAGVPYGQDQSRFIKEALGYSGAVYHEFDSREGRPDSLFRLEWELVRASAQWNHLAVGSCIQTIEELSHASRRSRLLRCEFPFLIELESGIMLLHQDPMWILDVTSPATLFSDTIRRLFPHTRMCFVDAVFASPPLSSAEFTTYNDALCKHVKQFQLRYGRHADSIKSAFDLTRKWLEDRDVPYDPSMQLWRSDQQPLFKKSWLPERLCDLIPEYGVAVGEFT